MVANRITIADKIPHLTVAALKSGMKAHLSYGWPRDFHAEAYRQYAYKVRNGLTPDWWDSMVPILWGWVAIRPKSKEYVRKRGHERLDRLSCEYKRLRKRFKNPSIGSCEWDDVAGLFEVAHEIKGVDSPVLACKLCHFILPAAFVVFDNAALQLTPDPNACVYQEFWEVSRQRWHECKCKDDLKKVLHDGIIKADKNSDVAGYPWAAKIASLCPLHPKS